MEFDLPLHLAVQQGRRDTLKQMFVAAALAPLTTSCFGRTPSGGMAERVKGIALRDSTIRKIDLFGAQFASTWTSDDRQLISAIEGANPDATHPYMSRVFALNGGPLDCRFELLPEYPDFKVRLKKGTGGAPFWGSNCLAVGNTVYQLLCTPNVPYVNDDGSFATNWRFAGAKAIYSPDNGMTWHNQDGSTPVVADKWDDRSTKNMLFWNEELGRPRFLQMGKAYRSNKDGYVYLYADTKKLTFSATGIALLRVPRDKILKREAYQCYAGKRPNGDVIWSKDLNERQAIHDFGTGRTATNVEDGNLPVGWGYDIVFNEALNLYMMIADANGVDEKGGHHGSPTYMAFYVASAPWGPFRKVHEEPNWTPNGNLGARIAWPQIPSKWIAADGKSFWVTWIDYAYEVDGNSAQNPDGEVVRIMKQIPDEEEAERVWMEWTMKHQPRARYHRQRVDLLF